MWVTSWCSVSFRCLVIPGWGIWNEVKGRGWIGFEIDWIGVLKGVGLETEGVTGIWGSGGRVNVNETGESVIRKVLFGLFPDSSIGADGEGLESSLFYYLIGLLSGFYLATYWFKYTRLFFLGFLLKFELNFNLKFIKYKLWTVWNVNDVDVENRRCRFWN